MSPKLLVGSSREIFLALHRAGLFADDPSDVRRVVLDLEVGEPARVYLERFVDDSIVDVLLRGELELVERPPFETELVEEGR